LEGLEQYVLSVGVHASMVGQIELRERVGKVGRGVATRNPEVE
jgi:hypothetical protein